MLTTRIASIALLVCLVTTATAYADETIVFMRHAEKPSGGFGQLTCQGLNRALALPPVLAAQYGKPTFVYAPNPATKMSDPAGSFYYVRPLATIEPTAIKYGLSVNTRYGYNEIGSLQSTIVTSAKANATVFVAWEHAYLVKIVQNIMDAYGGGLNVPAWISGDYDTMYVVRIHYGSSGPMATFDIDHQHLNGQPTACP
jgi:hypothetical protein